MATSLPLNVDIATRDPYELNRLADELASRGILAGHTEQSVLKDGLLVKVPELHEPPPLSHNNPRLTAEVFDVEEFLLERRQIPLSDLRAELREYLGGLKEELVKLINDDYEAFISLSTDLRDEGARLERLKQPLATLKADVNVSKKELEAIQEAIHRKLSSRAKLREEQAILHLLLKISDSVIRLESLLLICQPDQDIRTAREMGNSSLLQSSYKDDKADERPRGNRAKHLARVAAEYTQLLYHVRKACTEKCAFVNEVQWRLDRIQSTLSSDLDQLFAQTLNSLINPKGENKGTELEKNKWVTDLMECLRTYDVLGLWPDAEDIIRREVMRAFVKKTIYPGALAAPPSPIVPNTPFRSSIPEPATSLGIAQQIPYTPFTAFVTRQNTVKVPEPTSDLPRAHLLDETDDTLARLYNQLLRFVERDVCQIMSLAEKIAVKPQRVDKSIESTEANGNAEKEKRGFRIMADVVWDEMGRAIMEEIGSIVFAAGNPKEFRMHYETTQSFIRSLELLAPSRQAVHDMRNHPIFAAFERRWQLPVYFQLRWKEIIGTMEGTLSLNRLEPINPKNGSFATPAAAAVWFAISACWSSDIYLPELSHRFWKLTLQILSRFRSWIDESISVGELSKGASSEKAAASPNATRAGTPVSETPFAESLAAEDVLLRQYAAAVADIKSMETNVMTLWRQVISIMLPDLVVGEFLAEDALGENLCGLSVFVDHLSIKIIAILTKRCYDNLLPVRSIPTQLRMSNRRAPAEPSTFVSSILRPIKQFFANEAAGAPCDLLKDTHFHQYCSEVFNNVTQRYISYLTAIKKAEEPLRRLKKKTRPAFSLFPNSPNVNDDVKDEERIRSQMILDVEAFRKDALSLGIDVDLNPHFASLKEIVYATDPE